MMRWILALLTWSLLIAPLAKAGGPIPFLFMPAQQGTAPYIWIGGGGDSNWNNTANWSTGVVPGSGQVAIFDDHCSGASCNVTVNVDPNVGGVDMKSTYTGTITQSAGVIITVGSSGWLQAGGTFVGSSSTIMMTNFGKLNLQGGSFTSTSGILQFGGNAGGT
ncbi:MAG: hypothetical protein NDI61_03820, partial [Bdellovibrionaceae bacterium]|nr:hypothetical protein [Pseudobdellovibrionaceae bacterium]